MAGKTPRFTSNGGKTHQLWEGHLGQMLCDANSLSHSCQRKFNEFSFSFFFFFFFVYRVVSIQGFGRETPTPQCSVHGGSLHTHPTESQSSLSTFMQHALILWHQKMLLMSILPFCANIAIKKDTITDCYSISVPPTRPTFSGSSLFGVDGKLGQTEEENRYKLTPATWNRIGHSASRDTFKTSACLCACLLSETFAVAVALPALSHPRLMVLVLCNLAITVHHLSNAGLFFSPFARHNRRNLNYGDSVIVVSCCFF